MSTPNPFLVFLELSAPRRASVWREEAFIDRGIRKRVERGVRVAVTSLASAEAALRDPLAQLASGAWSLSFVWNTGRCGST